MQGIYFGEKKANTMLFFSGYANGTKMLALYGLVLFLAPFFSANQLIVGTIVNAILLTSAIKMKSRRVYLLSIIPSIAAFSAGHLFGGLTTPLVLMLPFIWAGNAVLMLAARRLFVKGKKEFFYSNIMGGALKTAMLFTAAAALFFYGFAPAIALTAFGIIQFATAQAGGLVAILAQKGCKRITTS